MFSNYFFIMDILQRQFKSNENSPCLGLNNKFLMNHHRTKALVHNVAFNSLSQKPTKFYTVTIDEAKMKEALTSKIMEKAIMSTDQKRLVIEDIEQFSEDKKDFMNFKFGKKYYTSKLKNPLFSTENGNTKTENSTTLNSFSEKTRSEENKTIPIFEKENITINKNPEEKIPAFEINTKSNSERIHKTERKITNYKLLKYLEKLKKSNVVVDVDDLKNKISSKTQSGLSKSMNFHKIMNHKFNSNTLLECKSDLKSSFIAESNILEIVAEFPQMKQKIKTLEKEITIINERNEKERLEFEKKYNFMENRLHKTELVLREIFDKLSMI